MASIKAYSEKDAELITTAQPATDDLLHDTPAIYKGHVVIGSIEPPPFKWSSLWSAPVINPINLKSYTLPILNLNNPYSRNFHLAWLSFFVAFLSWFAFPPLFPEAIRQDLRLTPVQVANSNIVSLCSTLAVRLILGPLVDRFGPRLTMAGILVLGAIPSGLAGTVSSANGLYAIRFFIGLLGASFVPCLAWTTCFYDKNVVGTANAIVGGLGNMGGGATFCIMVGLYEALTKTHGLSQHVAWRAAFAIVPVPILLGMALLVFFFGTDHPVGKWSDRHNTRATAISVARGHAVVLDGNEKHHIEQKSADKEAGTAVVRPAEEQEEVERALKSELDVAVNEALTWASFRKVVSNPLTWLPAFSYLSSFGYELAIDSFLVNILFILFRSPDFGQLEAGFYTSIFGFLNIVTRPAGGLLGDLIYKKYGVPGKKYLMLFLAGGQGVVSLGIGAYIQNNTSGTYVAATGAATGSRPELATMMGLVSLLAILNETANGANFALVPHCAPYNSGFITGIVGAFGSMGGIIFAVIFRFKGNTLLTLGMPFYIAGGIIVGINLILCLVRVPRW